MFGDPPVRFQFGLQGEHPQREGLFVLHRLLRAVVQVQVHASVVRDGTTLVRAFPRAFPADEVRMAVHLMRLVVVIERPHRLSVGPDGVLHDRKPRGHRDQETEMVGVQFVDVPLAVEAAVHHQLHLRVPQYAKVPYKSFHRLDIRDVPRKLPVIERQVRFLSVHQKQVQLRQPVMVLVLSIAYLPQLLRPAGYGRAVIGPELLSRPSFPLEPEEQVLPFFGDRGEQLAAPLRGDVPTERMAVEG